MTQNQAPSTPAAQSGGRWFKSNVTSHTGTIAEVRRVIPSFERRGFGLAQPGENRSRVNEHQDVIVRTPIGDDKDYVPVGVVSKDYSLVQHLGVVDVVVEALKASKLEVEKVRVRLKITDYGERMALSVFLPDAYSFDPGDGHPMSLRLECINSVDGSTGFRVLVGWYRFVCGNGLIVGVTRSDLRRRHVGEIALEDVAAVLQSGLEQCESEKRSFALWRQTEIADARLGSWVDGDLRKAWGFKAAARAFHISNTGADVTVVGPYKGYVPTTIRVERGPDVPGAAKKSRNLFDLSQVLAWLARDRVDVQEQLAWREQIAGILTPCVPHRDARPSLLD
jgi:hypothetical protein